MTVKTIYVFFNPKVIIFYSSNFVFIVEYFTLSNATTFAAMMTMMNLPIMIQMKVIIVKKMIKLSTLQLKTYTNTIVIHLWLRMN